MDFATAVESLAYDQAARASLGDVVSPGKTMNTGMVTLNGVSVIDPSELTWGLQDVSAPDAGRDEAVRMHKLRIGQLRKYELAWNGIDPANAAIILQAINAQEEFPCTLHDAMTNTMQTRIYYVGDRSAPFKQWMPDRIDGKVYSKISFNLIEVFPDSNLGEPAADVCPIT